jgi:hypothetical protein
VFHPRSTTYVAARAVVLLALTAGGLTAATAAAASTAGSTFSSVPVSYTCSLSGYSRSAAPLNLSASLGAQSTVSTGTDLTVEVVTSSAQLPASLASSMPAISYIGAAGASAVTGGSVSLSGQSPQLGMAAGAMTEIPSLTVTGMMVPRNAGTAYAEAPRSLQLVPADGSTKLAPITCTATSVVRIQVIVTSATSTGSGSGSGATVLGGSSVVAGAQVYRCTVTAATATTSVVDVPMRLRHSGPNVVGTPDDVSLYSPSDAFGGALSGTATPMAVTASLGLTGAYAGSIPLADSGGAGQVLLSGRWMPQLAGAFRLRAPSVFSVRLRTAQATTVSVMCTAITTTTTTTVVRVTVAKGSTLATGPTLAAVPPTTVASGKAPDTGTGGSLHATANLTLAAGGSAIVMAGIVIIALALRRRRGRAAI